MKPKALTEHDTGKLIKQSKGQYLKSTFFNLEIIISVVWILNTGIYQTLPIAIGSGSKTNQYVFGEKVRPVQGEKGKRKGRKLQLKPGKIP